MLLLKAERFEITLILSLFLGWMPISNPLAAILIIKPYRRKVKAMLGFKNTSTNNITTRRLNRPVRIGTN